MKITDEFLTALKNKEEWAWGEGFWQIIKEIVYPIAYNFFHNEEDVEDVGQDVWINKYKAIERYEPHLGKGNISQNFRAWISENTTNICINKIKKERRETPVSQLPDYLRLDEDWEEKIEEDILSAGRPAFPTPPFDPKRELLKKEIRDCIDKELSNEQRIIAQLRFWAALKWREIAEILNINENTLQADYYHRHIKPAIKRCLEKKGIEVSLILEE